MIEIAGLNRTQRALADIMWGMNSKDEVLGFIRTLKGQSRKDAEVVMELMVLAVYDEIDTVNPEVAGLIDEISKR